MRTTRLTVALLLGATAALAQPGNTQTAGKHSKTHKALHSAVAHHEPSVAMPAERATQIQNALIKQGYMTGTPSGQWDAQTAAAMQKLQEDNGWQTKITPDSRALIKLGLGPQETASLPQQ
jgi:hypothetical protein